MAKLSKRKLQLRLVGRKETKKTNERLEFARDTGITGKMEQTKILNFLNQILKMVAGKINDLSCQHLTFG